MFRRRAIGLATAIALLTAGCGDTDSWVKATAARGWPAQYADAANSNHTSVRGASELQLDWARSVKGQLGAGPALGSDGWIALNAQTESGCSLMEWENAKNGRQRWCTRLYQGAGFSGALFDDFDNVYVGQPGAILSFPPTQWIRWRAAVAGTPLTPRILGPGHLLVLTHLGQAQVFDAHRGTPVGSAIELVEGAEPIGPEDFRRGLDDCAVSGPQCPVAVAPAFSAKTSTLVVTVWQPGAKSAGLIGLRYQPGLSPPLARKWSSHVVSAGVLGSPALSADGTTIYVNGRDKRLWALDAADGKAKWSVPLKFAAETPPAVSPDGVIISGGGREGVLVAFRDRGDRAEQLWRRRDVTTLSSPSLAGGAVGYVVVSGAGAAPEGMSLLVFDPSDGTTLNTYALPESDGAALGVSVGADRRVVVATGSGQLYSFAPA